MISALAVKQRRNKKTKSEIDTSGKSPPSTASEGLQVRQLGNLEQFRLCAYTEHIKQ